MLVLDIETTGLPKTKGYGIYYNPKDITQYNSSRIVSIAFISPDGFENYSIIKPNDFKINNSHFHKITQKKALEKGKTLKDFFSNELFLKIKNSDFILGHNIHFDINVLLSELYRQGLFSIYSMLEKKRVECSMELGKNYYNLQKSPKLTDLYFTLFQSPFKGSHNALSDAKACLACYKKMS